MTNYDLMWDLLERYQFEVDSKWSDHVKCIICNYLLTDACQGPCGCLYCRSCIDKYLEDSNKYCPGHHNDCKLVFLDIKTNIIKNNNANCKVSGLLVKCPFNLCNFETLLIDMGNHIRICEKLPINCPYRDVGCLIDPLFIDELTDHLQTETYVHNKLLIKWIMEMKENYATMIADERQKPIEDELEKVFSKISEVLSKKQVLIGNMFKELKDIKLDMEQISKITDSTNKNNDNNYKEILVLKEKKDKELIEMKKDLYLQILKLQKELDYQKLLSKKKENEIKNLNKKIKKFEDLFKNTSSIMKYSVEKIIKIASFRWTIDSLKDSRNDGEELLYSEYFYSINGEYKMRIWIYPNGNGEVIGNDITMQLLVWNNNNNAIPCGFPLKADVTLSVKNTIKPHICHSISHLCLFNKPDIFIYSISEPFNFNYFHLKEAGIFNNDIVTVECVFFIYK